MRSCPEKFFVGEGTTGPCPHTPSLNPLFFTHNRKRSHTLHGMIQCPWQRAITRMVFPKMRRSSQKEAFFR
jgi:hypothetical protein